MVAETDSFERIFETYKRFCYTFGRSFDRNPNRDIIKLIYQADLEMTPGMFTSLWIMTTILTGAVMIMIASFIFLLPQSPFAIPAPAPYILLFALIGSAAIAIGFPFYLQNQIENKKRDIDTQIPYALSFMSILASSGATPLDIIRRIAREEYGQISNEFRKVLFRVDVLGEDVVTAMNGLIQNTPSDLFRDICIDITNIIYGGGGLKSYLETKSKELMAIRRQTYKEFVESLAVFGEGYLGGVVMTITLAILGVVISGALGIQLGPFSAHDMFNYLIYLMIPLINVIFLQMLAVKYSTNP
ncbi:type II secretion system F family protein [Methanoregula sp.]|uniref:type II secretion system F family protein n=1 Tax=Methanoregula sp. TaxID=2052170 RepID=UPI002B92FF3A|nr:type II secretion system F family protein [Methanoregula sp.]HVP97015.1 type II secretion system F family protein [Methanoregula sp.]